MATPPPHMTPTLYQTTTQQRLQNYEYALQQGTYRPFVYPWDSLPALWLVIALLIFPRLPRSVLKYIRLPTFVLVLGHCVYVGANCRTIGLAGGYGIGLSAMWGCIMSMALLLTGDLEKDFTRLEVRLVNGGVKSENHSNGSATTSSTSPNSSQMDLRRRKDISAKSTSTESDHKNPSSYTLTWQSYPSTLAHSLDWNIDLITAFRGVNWNFRNPTLPQLPSNITQQTHTPSTPDLHQIQFSALRDFLIYYMLVDIFKSLCIQDPYFLGLAPLSSPSPYPLLQPHPILTRFLRLLLAISSTQIVLSLIFTLSPLLFPLLPHKHLKHLTRSPLHHPAMYPPYFHPPLPTIPRSGLAGFWGKHWHQLFRFGISQPAVFLTKYFDIPPKSQVGRALQLLTAFTLSGSIHACASYTSFPPNGNVTRPLSGPLAFFVLQAVGIMLQTWLTGLVRRKIKGEIPRVLKYVGNTAFVGIWLFVTGPLLADDFARCGVWLFEPVPVSFVRGVRGEGWWCWGGRWVGWSQGRWWETGIGIY